MTTAFLIASSTSRTQNYTSILVQCTGCPSFATITVILLVAALLIPQNLRLHFSTFSISIFSQVRTPISLSQILWIQNISVPLLHSSTNCGARAREGNTLSASQCCFFGNTPYPRPLGSLHSSRSAARLTGRSFFIRLSTLGSPSGIHQ